MAKRYYTLEKQFTLPAWSMSARHWDGIYINGVLFEQNIPVVDTVAWLQVTPQGKYTPDHWCNIGFPTFTNGEVIRIGHKFYWIPWNDTPQAEKLLYNGHPYGMGLNTISVVCTASVPYWHDIVYDVSIILEVDV